MKAERTVMNTYTKAGGKMPWNEQNQVPTKKGKRLNNPESNPTAMFDAVPLPISDTDSESGMEYED